MKKIYEDFDEPQQAETKNDFVSGQDLSANNLNLDQLKSYEEFKLLFSKGENDIINFLTKNSQHLKATSPNGSNLIHWASAYNMQSLVKYLFEKGFDLNATNNDGLTAVHYACMSNPNIKVIEFLVETGKLDLTAKAPGGLNALHFALGFNPNIEVIKYLVETEKFDLNAKTFCGFTALHYACKYNPKIEVIKYLLEKGSDNHQRDNLRSSALEKLFISNEEIYNEALKYFIAAEFADLLIYKELDKETILKEFENCTESPIEFIEAKIIHKIFNTHNIKDLITWTDNLEKNLSLLKDQNLNSLSDLTQKLCIFGGKVGSLEIKTLEKLASKEGASVTQEKFKHLQKLFGYKLKFAVVENMLNSIKILPKEIVENNIINVQSSEDTEITLIAENIEENN